MEVGKPLSVLLAAILAAAPSGLGAQESDPTTAPVNGVAVSAPKPGGVEVSAWECPGVALIDSDAGLAVLKGDSRLTVVAAGVTVDELGVRIDEVLHDRVLVTPLSGVGDWLQYWLYPTSASQPVACTMASLRYATPVRVEPESTVIVVPEANEAEGPTARIVTHPPPDEVPRPDIEGGNG